MEHTKATHNSSQGRPARSSSPVSWDSELFDPRRYLEVLERIAHTARERPSILVPRPASGPIPLSELLAHRQAAVTAILGVLRSGSAQLSGLTRVVLSDGSRREVYIAPWADRIVLMVMARILTERLEPGFSPSLYSFRRGMGTWSAIRAFEKFVRARATSWKPEPLLILRRDIRKFGDSIPRERLLAKLRTVPGYSESRVFRGLLEESLTSELLPGAHGIPSGSPVVPVLENLYLAELDARLAAIPDAFFARFGDDLLFASRSLSSTRQAERVISDEVARAGLVLHPEKNVNAILRDRYGSGSKPVPALGPEYAGFTVQSAIEWLGTRLQVSDRETIYGPKRERTRAALAKLKRHLRALVRSVAESNLTEPDRVSVLRSGLRELTDLRSHSALAPIILETNSRRLLKQLDRECVRALLRELEQAFGLGRSEAWRLLRKLRYRSLACQNRARAAPRKAAA